MIILLIVPKIRYYKLEVVGNHAIGLKPMFMFTVICTHWTHGGWIKLYEGLHMYVNCQNEKKLKEEVS